MAARPRLKPHARLLRRGAGALQVGLAADAGVVLEELSEAEIALVARLDGSLDLPGLHAVAVSTGVAPGRVTGLLPGAARAPSPARPADRPGPARRPRRGVAGRAATGRRRPRGRLPAGR